MSFYLLKTTRHRNVGVEYERDPGERNENLVFQPQKLTAEGLRYRRRFCICAWTFAVSLSAIFAILISTR